MAQFAIGDTHGCAKTFAALLDQIQLSPSDELFMLGDYIDRGPDSKGVVDQVWKLREDGYRVHCLMGNHEQMLLESLMPGGELSYETWLHNGGEAALRSFGLQDNSPVSLIPKPYLKFFAQLDLHLESNGYILVHAGLNFEDPDPLNDVNGLLWIRDFYDSIDLEWLDGRIILHGHTPKAANQIKFQLTMLPKVPVLNLDAGCVFNRGPYRSLCAFNMTTRELYFQPNIEA